MTKAKANESGARAKSQGSFGVNRSGDGSQLEDFQLQAAVERLSALPLRL